MTLGEKNTFIDLVVEASRMLDTDQLRMLMDELQQELTRREDGDLQKKMREGAAQ